MFVRRQPHEAVRHRDHRLGHDRERRVREQVVGLWDRARQRVLDREHAVADLAARDRAHDVRPRPAATRGRRRVEPARRPRRRMRPPRRNRQRSSAWLLHQQKSPRVLRRLSNGTTDSRRAQTPPGGVVKGKANRARYIARHAIRGRPGGRDRGGRRGRGRGVEVGIGDDAAVLAGGIVASTDMLVEGVHFDSGCRSARDIGHRAGGEPFRHGGDGRRAALPARGFGLPDGFDERRRAGGRDGRARRPAGRAETCPQRQLLVAVTAHRPGRAARAALRRQRPGDVLVVTGTLGGQAAGGLHAAGDARGSAEGRALRASRRP